MPSLPEDISAAVDAFGVEYVGIVWGIGMTPWESAEQRDSFLRAVTEEQRG